MKCFAAEAHISGPGSFEDSFFAQDDDGVLLFDSEAKAEAWCSVHPLYRDGNFSMQISETPEISDPKALNVDRPENRIKHGDPDMWYCVVPCHLVP